MKTLVPFPNRTSGYGVSDSLNSVFNNYKYRNPGIVGAGLNAFLGSG